MSREIYIFADWEEFDEPMFVGTLRSDLVKAKEHFSFAYDEQWLKSQYVQQIDPDLQEPNPIMHRPRVNKTGG